MQRGNQPMRYADMIARYGADGAFDMLVIIEKLARTGNTAAVHMTEEERLQTAFARIGETGPATGPQQGA